MLFDEKETLLAIKEGKELKEFVYENYEWEKEPSVWPTRLMVLATLTYHGKDAYLEIPESAWTPRTAKMAVEANFRAIDVIPEHLKCYCSKVFTEQYLKQSRRTIKEYMDIFHKQPEMFQNSCIGYNPGLSKNKEERMRRITQKINAYRTTAPKPEIGNYELSFEGDEDFSNPEEMTPNKFLNLPAEEQTESLLRAMLDMDIKFPQDFLKTLIMPLRNASYYKRIENQELSEYWNAKILPYLDKEFCIFISEKHPEAAISFPMYLTPKAVQMFWDKEKEKSTPKDMTKWFISFPEHLLNDTMLPDIAVNQMAMHHAPRLLKGSKEAKQFLLKMPNAVLSLPEYQTPGFLLLDGVVLNKKTVEKIANEAFREKVKIALNI